MSHQFLSKHVEARYEIDNTQISTFLRPTHEMDRKGEDFRSAKTSAEMFPSYLTLNYKMITEELFAEN